MKQMNRLLRRYGTKRFEELLASVKLGELLDKKDDDDDILKWILIIVGAIVCVATIVGIIVSITKRCERKRLEDEYDDFDEIYGSEEE